MPRKLELQDLRTILSSDVVTYNTCIEMSFYIDNDEKYSDCWLGKKPDRSNSNDAIFWYGLVEDGSEAYNYKDIDELLTSKVFDGKSLSEIIKEVTFYSLDGCPIDEMLPYYLEDGKGPIRSAPIICYDENQQNDITQLKHSKLGIMAFVILLSPIIPLSNVYIFRWRILLLIFKFDQILLISTFFTYWIICAPIFAFVFSNIDLKKSDRLKTLPRFTLILSSIIIGIGIIGMIMSTISDLNRLS